MDLTSTVPGLIYATPRFADMAISLLVLLERQLERKPKLALVAGRRDLSISVQRLHAAIRIERRRSDGRARLSELRRVGQVEDFGAELQLEFLRQAEVPEQTGIGIKDAGAAQNIATAVAEAYRSDWREGRRVEIGRAVCANAVAAGNGDVG